MIQFNSELIRFEYVKLKSVSVAMGGSLRILDQELSTPDKQMTARYQVPYAVARQYQQANTPSSYIVPVDACIAWYGDQIVNIEKRAAAIISHDHMGIDMTDLEGQDRWMSEAEFNFNRDVAPIVSNSDQWYTDGTFIYELPSDMNIAIHGADRLSEDGMFRSVTVNSIKFSHMSSRRLASDVDQRTLVACVHSNGQVILTPPIWKDVTSMRGQNISTEGSQYRFDAIDAQFNVNLEFALNAGKTIGSVFGYNHIAPLKLDELMIHLCTVNLPKVNKSVRATFGIGIPFLQAFAWVAGLSSKCESMADYTAMRGLLKQLCTKGIFVDSLLKKVFSTDHCTLPPTLDKQEILDQVRANEKFERDQRNLTTTVAALI